MQVARQEEVGLAPRPSRAAAPVRRARSRRPPPHVAASSARAPCCRPDWRAAGSHSPRRSAARADCAARAAAPGRDPCARCGRRTARAGRRRRAAAFLAGRSAAPGLRRSPPASPAPRRVRARSARPAARPQRAPRRAAFCVASCARRQATRPCVVAAPRRRATHPRRARPAGCAACGRPRCSSRTGCGSRCRATESHRRAPPASASEPEERKSPGPRRARADRHQLNAPSIQ